MWVIVITAQDPCDPNPCQNGGQCNGGVCTCTDGFTGDRCETRKLKPIYYAENVHRLSVVLLSALK